MLPYMLAYMVPYEGVQIKFKLDFTLGNGAEWKSVIFAGAFAVEAINALPEQSAEWLEACRMPDSSDHSH